MVRRLAFLLAFLAFAPVACSDDPTQPGARILVLSGANVTDTVMAELAEPLVFEMRDEDGEPAAGRELLLVGYGLDMFDPVLGIWRRGGRHSTDEMGRVSRRLRFGSVAQPAYVLIDAPDLGVRDTAWFEVLPGAADGMGFDLSWDWTVSVGGTDRLHAYVRDRFWNERPEPVTYAAIDDDVVAIDEDGVVTGLQIGVGRVSAHGAGFASTFYVTVVPPGRLVARKFERFGPPELVTFEVDGPEGKTLAVPLTFGSMAPDWAPTGDRVVFHALVNGVLRLHVAGASDAPEMRLILEGSFFDWESYPQYSPDGEWIYFGGQARGEPHAVWRVRPDGTDPERVGPLYEDATVFSPTVSPDGGRVAFSSRPFGTTDWRLYVLDVATGAVDSLGISGQGPRWSPVDDRIAFVWQGVVYSVRPDGTDVQRVSELDSGYDSSLDWSPDGKWLAVSTPAGHNRVSFIDLLEAATGRTLHLIFTTDRAEPSWHPTGELP